MQQMLIPFLFDDLGYEHRDPAASILYAQLLDQADDGAVNLAILRRQNDEPGWIHPGGSRRLLDSLLPLLMQPALLGSRVLRTRQLREVHSNDHGRQG
jgi:hypothetical protein